MSQSASLKARILTAERAQATHWDVTVVGGGMVGAATALGLGKQGFRVLLLERKVIDPEWDENLPYQPRVSALTRASENILSNLGAWQGVEKRRLHPFVAMHVWDEITEGSVHFSASDIGEPNLGYTVENNVIQAALWEQVALCEQIGVMFEVEPVEWESSAGTSRLRLNNGAEIVSDLVVGADGAFSKVRQLASIGLDTHDYEQCAVVGCVKTEASHQDTCWQRYRKEGPFAYLAMGYGVSSIAWYLPTEKMQWATSLSDSDFAEEVSKASGYKLGRVTEVSERVAFPLVRRHAEHYVKPGLALVGDSAHTVHPQAGQGVNLGLLDAAALIETLQQARQQSKPIGSLSVLRRYERWRRGDNAIVQRSMEGFDWLFRQDAVLKGRLRGGLLPLADRVQPVKNWLMKQALKGRGPLPKLAE